MNTNVTKEQTKVGLILNGSKDDKSWCQSHWEAMRKTARKLNLEVIIVEDVPEDTRVIPVMEKLVSEGCKVIICTSFGYGDYEFEFSKKHPDIYFFHATGLNYSKNFISYFGRIYQARFLSGIVAGFQTKTNKIGYVAAMPIPEVNRGINAFTLGVKFANPKAKVIVTWSKTWGENAQTSLNTEFLLAAHPDIDVLAMHTDSQKVLEIAEERGIWSVGYNIDTSKYYPKTFLTAPVWNWEIFYEKNILAVLQGKFIGGHFWYDAETEMFGLSKLSGNVNSKSYEPVERMRKKIESGEFDVFYGPIYDNQGNLKVEKDENMSDEQLLKYFDWYVDGVEIYE